MGCGIRRILEPTLTALSARELALHEQTAPLCSGGWPTPDSLVPWSAACAYLPHAKVEHERSDGPVSPVCGSLLERRPSVKTRVP